MKLAEQEFEEHLITYIRKLKFDGAKEKFVNDPEADKMLTKKYRPPYVIPEKI